MRSHVLEAIQFIVKAKNMLDPLPASDLLPRFVKVLSSQTRLVVLGLDQIIVPTWPGQMHQHVPAQNQAIAATLSGGMQWLA